MLHIKMLRLITTPDEVLFMDLIITFRYQQLRVPSGSSQISSFIQ